MSSPIQNKKAQNGYESSFAKSFVARECFKYIEYGFQGLETAISKAQFKMVILSKRELLLDIKHWIQLTKDTYQIEASIKMIGRCYPVLLLKHEIMFTITAHSHIKSMISDINDIHSE